MVYDKSTGLLIGDPDVFPFRGEHPPGEAAIRRELEKMILSFSGWRKVFDKGGEEGSTGIIDDVSLFLCAAAAKAFVDFLGIKRDKERHRIAVGIDTRHSGPAIADVVIRALIASNAEVNYLFISPAPEIMIYAGKEEVDGYIYISASHNPIGHNGFKFGLKNGGVLSGADSSVLIELYKKYLDNITSCHDLFFRMKEIPSFRVKAVFSQSETNKRKALKRYRELTEEILTGGGDPGVASNFCTTLKRKIAENSIGIVAELNGSARTVSIDSGFLESLGVCVKMLNDRPRQIVHKIIPEGESLELCRLELDRIHKRNAIFELGYVPDNDGDRGNIVYFDKSKNRSFILEAQEVFALTCLSELAWIHYSGVSGGSKIGVVVNGPTSLRIDEIARVFNAEVFRTEVGEANVVGLAEDLRKKGWTIRLLGEGSNGGNITHPAAVRDPINTVGSLLKLLRLGSSKGRPGLFELWCRNQDKKDYQKKDYSLSDIINTLPSFQTTGVSEDRAVYPVGDLNHGKLKSGYEKVFLEKWEIDRNIFEKRFGISSWEIWNYEGIHSRCGMGSNFRSGNEDGGFKVLFRDRNNAAVGFLWMRGSKTEPVFRIMADVKSSKAEDEKYLLEWHTNIIKNVEKSI